MGDGPCPGLLLSSLCEDVSLPTCLTVDRAVPEPQFSSSTVQDGRNMGQKQGHCRHCGRCWCCASPMPHRRAQPWLPVLLPVCPAAASCSASAVPCMLLRAGTHRSTSCSGTSWTSVPTLTELSSPAAIPLSSQGTPSRAGQVHASTTACPSHTWTDRQAETLPPPRVHLQPSASSCLQLVATVSGFLYINRAPNLNRCFFFCIASLKSQRKAKGMAEPRPGPAVPSRR